MFEERVALADGRRLVMRFVSEALYSLSIYREGRLLVEYHNDGDGHHRRVRERDLAYDFRSVEQLRYDFERDAEDAQRQG